MQVQKDDIRSRVLREARKLFVQKGFLKTSMREIAERADVSVANIYNYFDSKDEIFTELTAPARDKVYRMLSEHHGIKGDDVLSLGDESYYRSTLDEYREIIGAERDAFRLLLLGAEGSSQEGFKDEYVRRSTAQVMEWFKAMKSLHPEINVAVSEAFVRLNTLWMLSLLEELVRGVWTEEEQVAVLDDFVKFEIEGWRAMMHV